MSIEVTCANKPCKNGGSCVADSVSGFKCGCPTGFSGLTCELAPCQSNPCQNSGKCYFAENSAMFYCDCVEGVYGDYCEISINIYIYIYDYEFVSLNIHTVLPLFLNYFKFVINFFPVFTAAVNMYCRVNCGSRHGIKLTVPCSKHEIHVYCRSTGQELTVIELIKIQYRNGNY